MRLGIRNLAIGICLFFSSSFAVAEAGCDLLSYSDEMFQTDLAAKKTTWIYIFSNQMILSMTEIPQVLQIAKNAGWQVRLVFESNSCFSLPKFEKLMRREIETPIFQLTAKRVQQQTMGIHYPASFLIHPEGHVTRTVYGVMPATLWKDTLQSLLQEVSP